MNLKKNSKGVNDHTTKIPQRKWYSVTCKDNTDGIGPGSTKITSVAHQMHIKCGWYQIQGTRGYGAHCTPQEINRLINELGRDKYSYYVMSWHEIHYLKKDIGWPF